MSVTSTPPISNYLFSQAYSSSARTAATQNRIQQIENPNSSITTHNNSSQRENITLEAKPDPKSPTSFSVESTVLSKQPDDPPERFSLDSHIDKPSRTFLSIAQYTENRALVDTFA